MVLQRVSFRRHACRCVVAGAVLGLVLSTAEAAYGQHVKIVGIGASSCARFVEDTTDKPEIERNYVAWAQGFMSATLLLAPKGRDESLDLAPDTLRLSQQAAFLRRFCESNPTRSYTDGVIALYRTLRGVAGER